MPFQPVPNTAEVIVRGTLGGQNIVNTYYAQFSGGYDQTDLDNLSEQVDDWVGTEWLPIISNKYAYVSTDVRGLDNEFDLTSSNNDSAGVGAISGDAVPNNVALSVKRRSNFTGRGARGRIFVAGLPEDSVDTPNHISDAFVTAVEAALNAMQSYLTTAGAQGVIVHRISAGVPLTTAVVFTIIEWVVMDQVIDSMRRRLPGRGT